MTFISRAVRYVLRERVRTVVLFIVLTIITASMLSATAVSQAAQHEAGRIEKQAAGGFVLASNLQGSMLTVVPEKLRTLDHGRPWSDDQFASTRLSSNRDMSR